MKTNNDGFSLVELSLVLIIVGLMYGAVFTAYKHYLRQSQLDDTYETMRLIQGAFTEYAARRGHYPCPARRDARPEDSDYGVSVPGCAPSAPGLLRVDTGRDVGEDTTGDTEAILIGAIPFNTMAPSLLDNKLLASDVTDAWGNKFTYAVTELLVTTSTYNDAWGAIRVTDEYGESIINPADSAHIVFYTHGPNAKGAYSAEGGPNPVEGCGFVMPPGPLPPGPVLLTDIENCDNDDGNFVSALLNESDFFYFDDVLRYQVNQISDLWTIGGIYEDPATGEIVNLYTNANIGNVGVGILDPNEKLEFSSGFRVTDDIIAHEVCDEGGTDCMPISRITGNDDEMQCASSAHAVKSISGSNTPGSPSNNAAGTNYRGGVNCEPIFGSHVTSDCPAGQYVTGISNAGYVICSSP